MFSVLFEVNPRGDQWDAYLGYAKMLRPELEQIDGFVDNIRYGSLTRDGWILSLSGWREEKSLVRWRTRARHHDVQVKGREQVFADYHLRVGQITQDTHVPDGYTLAEQRLDETRAGEGTTVTLIDARRDEDQVRRTGAEHVAADLGLDRQAAGLLSWDVFDAVLSPGDVILLLSWRDQEAADAFRTSVTLADGSRLRQIRVVRDYGMYDRQESPQYYPDVARFSDMDSPIGRAGRDSDGPSAPRQHEDFIDIAAPARVLYDLVTDVARTGEWSPICTGCSWDDARGLGVGAWFTGHNEAGGRTWETRSQVVVADPGREFAWLVGQGYVRWGYRFESLDAQHTRVTESWHFLPAGIAMFRGKYGVESDARMAERAQWAVEGIPATLAAIKRIAEGEVQRSSSEPAP